MNLPSSNVQLTRRQRHLLRTVAMLGACLATTTAGTVYLYSTYGPSLVKRLHLTSSQSNVVAIATNYGQLLSGPLFGWLADTLGPRVLSVFGALASFTAFSALAYTYQGTLGLPHWLVLVGYMVMVGLASQATNMAAVTTTTKNFKQNRGTAVSLCVAFFGLSPFMLSQINTMFFANGVEPDTFGYLKFLSYLGFGTSSLAAVMLSVVGFGPSRSSRRLHFDQERQVHRVIPDGFVVDESVSGGDSSSCNESVFSGTPASAAVTINEERRILMENGDIPCYNAVAKIQSANANVSTPPSSILATSTPSPPPVAATTLSRQQTTNADGIDYDTARDLGGMAYLRDPEAQLLALVLFMCAGIGLFYTNNIGTIVNAMYYSSANHPDPSTAQRLINHHVATVSLASFSGRLAIGALADTCKRLWGLPRSGLLVAVVVFMVASQAVAGSATNLHVLLVGSALTGMSYGCMFGFMPTLVSVWFGTKYFGSNWGVTTIFIGFSGQALGAFFGIVYDMNMPDQDPSKCPGGECYRAAFGMSMGAGLMGLLAAVVLARRRGRRRRENRRLWETQEIDHIEYVPFVLAE